MALHQADSVVQRVRDQLPAICQIGHIAGAVGFSVAVIHRGKHVWTRHLGYRDLETRSRPDDDTRYNINSLSKKAMAALVGIEVQRGTLRWDSKIKDVLPGFRQKDKMLEDMLTVTDLLSHRSGLTGLDDRWYGDDNAIIAKSQDTLTMFAALDRVSSFRDGWTYCNLGYEILAKVLEHINDRPYSTLLRERLFEPLNMSRTSTSWVDPPEDGNSTKAYTPFKDGSPYEHERPQLGQGTMGEAAGGVKSTIRDLIIWYQTWLDALDDPATDYSDLAGYNPLKQVDWITGHHAQLLTPSAREQAYGIGWARMQLPGALGLFSQNLLLPPIVAGKGAKSQPVFYHHGCMQGSLSVVYMLPETKSAVIVLSNTSGACDFPDYIGQLLVETIVDTPYPNDYIARAKQHGQLVYGYMDSIQEQLDKHQTRGTKSRPLNDYVGTYWTAERDFHLFVFEQNGQLRWRQPKARDSYPLRHYQDNTFAWNLPHDEMVRHARPYFEYGWRYYTFAFGTGEGSDEVVRLDWTWDPNAADTPTSLWKDGASDSETGGSRYKSGWVKI